MYEPARCVAEVRVANQPGPPMPSGMPLTGLDVEMSDASGYRRSTSRATYSSSRSS